MKNLHFNYGRTVSKSALELRILPNIIFRSEKGECYINGAHYQLGIEWLFLAIWIGWTK